MLKATIKKGFMGELEFSFFSVGNTVNEQIIFDVEKRVFLKDGERAERPSFSIPYYNTNEFMLALKEAIREFEGNTPDFAQGELKATKYHLDDMRKIVDGFVGLGDKK